MGSSSAGWMMAAAAACVAMPAMAAVQQVQDPEDGSFVSLGATPNQPGVYGVETRIGSNGTKGTWEVGVGRQTSVGSNFNQGQFAWGSPTAHDFTLVWDASGIRFTVGGLTVTDAGFAAPLLGDALKIDSKRDATIFVDMIDGVSTGESFTNGAGAIWYSPDAWGGDGFTVTGSIRVGTGQGNNSASGINFKVGDFTPNSVVPEPATWGLLIAGFGLVGASMRRRRPAAA